MVTRNLSQRSILTLIMVTLLTQTCTGSLFLSISECECGKSVILWCNSSSVTMGDNYEWRKESSLIYSSVETGVILNDKYLGSSTNGSIVLVILRTDTFDNGLYSCNHNFTDSNQVNLSLTCITSTSGSGSSSSSTSRSSSVSTTTVSTNNCSSRLFGRSRYFLIIASVLGSWLARYLRWR